VSEQRRVSIQGDKKKTELEGVFDFFLFFLDSFIIFPYTKNILKRRMKMNDPFRFC
jgi:hypothetical protein